MGCPNTFEQKQTLNNIINEVSILNGLCSIYKIQSSNIRRRAYLLRNSLKYIVTVELVYCFKHRKGQKTKTYIINMEYILSINLKYN